MLYDIIGFIVIVIGGGYIAYKVIYPDETIDQDKVHDDVFGDKH